MQLPVIFLWITFGGGFVSTQQECLGKTQCDCSETYINCLCQLGSREDINLNSINIANFDVDSITIRHCGKVTISTGAFLHLRLSSLILDDLLELQIMPVSILGVSMQSLEISNIVYLKASPYGLSGLNNLSQIHLKNITSDFIPHTFLVASNIENVTIEDCKFEEMVYSAFAFRNTTNILMAKTKIQTLQSMAIINSGISEKVNFSQSSFQYTENASFSIEASQLIFENCMFGELSAEVFSAVDVNVFTFDRNEVNLAKNEAFLDLNHNKTVYFTGNYIHETEENALTAFLAPSTSGAIANNSFKCNCGLEWMWHPSYSHIRETSYCVLQGTVLPAKEVEPHYDEDDRCIELVIIEVPTSVSEEISDLHEYVTSNAVTQSASLKPFLDASLKFIILICYLTVFTKEITC